MDWYPLWNSLRIAAVGSGIVFFAGDVYKRQGMDTEARGNMDVQAVRLGSGDLYEGNSEEEKPDGENPGEGKPEGENPEDKEWDILKHSFSPEWDSEGWRASSKVGTVTQQEDSVNILKPEEMCIRDSFWSAARILGSFTKRSIVYAGMWRISWKCFRGNCRNWTGIPYSI